MFYALNLSRSESGELTATCPDVPEMVFGPFKTEQEAADYCKDGVPFVLQECYRKARKAFPLPKTATGDILANVPLRVQAKIMLWNYMVANRYRISDVARILSMPASQVQRMVDVDKDGASIDAIEKALNAIGGEFDLTVK